MILGILVFLFALQNPEVDIPETFHPQQVFNRANYVMDQGRVEEAMESYRLILESGYESGPLHLNLALGYLRKDSLGLAVYHLKLSSQFPETRQRADQSFQVVESHLQSRRGTLAVLPLYAFETWLRSDIGAQKIFVLGIFFLNFAAAFFAWLLLQGNSKKIISYLALVSLILSIPLLISGSYLHLTSEGYAKAIVISREATIYEDYDTTSEPVGLAYEGFPVTLNQNYKPNYPGWVFVRMSNGLSGWVQHNHLRTL